MNNDNTLTDKICTAVWNEMVFPIIQEGKEPSGLWDKLRLEIESLLEQDRLEKIRKTYPSQHAYNRKETRMTQQRHKYHKRIKKIFKDCKLCLVTPH